MALQQRTTGTFGFRGGLLNRPPMPNDAAAYADFRNGLHMDLTTALTTAAANIVFSALSSMQPGYYYGRDDIQFSASTLWDRVEFGPTGECLGLRVEGSYQQRIVAGQRRDLLAGTASGAVVAADGAAAQPYQQWYSVTPAGAGEAGLTLATSAVATVGAYLYTAFDVRGSGIVQVGTAGTGYVNADLRSGEVRVFEDALGQAIQRPGGSWTIFCRARVPAGGLEDCAAYAASVASLDAPRRGASGAAFSARAPRLYASTSAGRPYAGLWPHTTSDTHPAESMTPNVAGIGTNDDFTVIFSARSGQLDRVAAGFWAIVTSGSTGTELRFTSDNALALINRSNNALLWTGQTKFAPSTVYKVGLSRAGSRLAVHVNGEGVSVDQGAAAGGPFRMLRGFDQDVNQWAGHLQKCIWWSGGRTQAELAALMGRWL